MRSDPTPRTASTFYGPALPLRAEAGTWLESETLAYPSGGFHRRAFAIIMRNPHNPISLPYGAVRLVRASVPDTHYSVPARLRYRGRTVRGYLSMRELEEISVSPAGESTTVTYPDPVVAFTPEADPASCAICAAGEGCKRNG
jgi:hypothetical protein